MNLRKSTTRHITIKVAKLYDKARILKVERKKYYVQGNFHKETLGG